MGADGGLSWIVPRGRDEREQRRRCDALAALLAPWMSDLTRGLPRCGETDHYRELRARLPRWWIVGPYGDFVGDTPLLDDLDHPVGGYLARVVEDAREGGYATLADRVLDLDTREEWRVEMDASRACDTFPCGSSCAEWDACLRAAPPDFLARDIVAWCAEVRACIASVCREETWP
jgi:hypothetical protein